MYIKIVELTLVLVARRVLLVWKTTLLPALFRDAGLPLAEAALEGAKIYFAIRLQTIDNRHLLVWRINLRPTARGQNTSIARRKTKIQVLGALLPEVPRPCLRTPHFSTDCRTNLTRGIDKETAAIVFKE
jgi:hypothetical protein